MSNQIAHPLACTLVENPTLIHLVLAARAMGLSRREGQMEIQDGDEPETRAPQPSRCGAPR